MGSSSGLTLVTGSAGKTGTAVIRALRRRDVAMRALVRRMEHGSLLRHSGVEDIVIGDMRDAGTWETAMCGVQSVYHICPNMSPDEIEIGRLALEAARRAGVCHFVYHSVLHPQIEDMPHHWRKMRVEELIFQSDLPFTILQPAAYMQNVLAGRNTITRDGIYRVPYALETRLSMVDLDDVGEAAAVVLTQPGHEGAIYELAGPEYLSQTELATILADVLGLPVCAESVPLAVWERDARATGLGDDQIKTLRAMFRYYEMYGFRGNERVLSWLLGRPATSFTAWATRAFTP